MTLSGFFDIFTGRQVVSIIGCGGKTTLLWALAQMNRGKKVLLTTTTHMQRPDSASGLFDFFFCNDTANFTVKNGITLAGNIDAKGKFGSLQPETLETLLKGFDISVIEADGSRGLPLKGWEHYEPVITESTTLTIGILPLHTIGMTADENSIHRLPLWTKLCRTEEGCKITHAHIADTIYSTNGKSLFSAAKGDLVLFLNRAESETSLEDAVKIVNLLPKDFLHTIKIIAAVSLLKNEFTILWDGGKTLRNF
ncbi:MAG: putative selenium-dependent hydroxylase accessory protein YqeC [Spirochaetaceae bacterium]|jgi:probable selenium-dependent hydroxylase accessory protein YqeC|nr:putative selenium-dependent hydroxylase accessory protein YqeC [Spirochaetaceae bacterium]